MVDFKPDRELETKEMKAAVDGRSPREVYSTWPTWLKTMAKVFAGLIIVILLVLIGRAIHHAIKNHDKTTDTSASAQLKQLQKVQAQQKKTGNAGSGTTTSPAPTPSPTASTPAGIPNTGPGDVAGLFFGAGAAGASAHYVLSRRSRR